MSLSGGGTRYGMHRQCCDIVSHICQCDNIIQRARDAPRPPSGTVPSGRGVLDDDTAVGNDFHRLPRRAQTLDLCPDFLADGKRLRPDVYFTMPGESITSLSATCEKM